MNNTFKWYLSPATIAFILMFITGGVQAVSSSLNPSLITGIMAVLGLAGAYFHNSTVQGALAGRVQ